MDDHEYLLVTGDGSHSIRSPQYGAAYHSIHGAIKESEVVFIRSGLEFASTLTDDTLKVFEMGFGTGLNALLTKQWAEKHRRHVYYFSIELHPLDDASVSLLNYGQLLSAQDDFLRLHQVAWNQDVALSPFFTLHKCTGNILEMKINPGFHAVYYDAFAPGTQPELWDEDAFRKMHQTLITGGALVSYCAQGAFKRNLKSAGFTVETLPGPPGKREMTRGIKMDI